MSSHERPEAPGRGGDSGPNGRRDRSFSPSPPSRRRSRSRSPRRRRDRSYSPEDRRSRDYHRRRGPPPPGYRDYPPSSYDRDRDYYDYPPPHHHPSPPYHHYPPPPHHHPGDYPPPPHRYDDRRGPPPPRFAPEDRPGPPPGRRDGRRREEGPPGVSLLIRNVAPDITTHDLQQAFGRIGELRDVYIPRDYHNQQPKGFAFIEYANPILARDARDEMNHFVIKGHALEVVFAQERRKTPNEMRGRVVNTQNRSSSFERHNLQQGDDKEERKGGNGGEGGGGGSIKEEDREEKS